MITHIAPQLPHTNWRVIPIVLVCCVVLASWVVPQESFAHGAGKEFVATDGAYRIDIGTNSYAYNTHDNVTFEFALVEASTDESLDYEQVWVQIKNEQEEVIYAGTLAPARGAGGALMVYRFPREGKYTLTTRYQYEGDTPEAQFSLPVEAKAGEQKDQAPAGLLSLILAVGGGIIIGVLGGMVLRWTRM